MAVAEWTSSGGGGEEEDWGVEVRNWDATRYQIILKTIGILFNTAFPLPSFPSLPAYSFLWSTLRRVQGSGFIWSFRLSHPLWTV
ncbi:hypothetical protein E2C01_050420 [Portunus trituberculatus]|uniref:Uncharacterized protein n=1 Tax=Portunus trituberculatus TaxID=210409 RepID=A0A5B7GG30_PORTR|nr:hypothetical protein [Portunus trituberculatus]